MATLDFSNPEIYVDWIMDLARAYHDPKIRYIFMKGGAGAGKSVAVSQMLLQNMHKYKLLCVRKVSETIKDSIHAEFLARISEW
jgi:phage terminase large subunit